MDRIFRGSFHSEYQTQTAGTEIAQLIKPSAGNLARITRLVYEAAGTAHTLTIMKALAQTQVSADAAASATSLVVDAGTFLNDELAANDYIVFQYEDGTWDYRKISAYSSGTCTVAALTRAVAEGSTVYIMGEVGNSAHQVLNAKASTVNTFHSDIAGVANGSFEQYAGSSRYTHNGKGRPILVHSDNGTAAGFLRECSGYYGTL